MKVEIIYYDKKTLIELKDRMKDNFTFANMDEYLNIYISEVMKTKTKEEVIKDYNNLKEFYFMYNSDAREQDILNYISK